MPALINVADKLEIMENVTVEIKSRKVTVKGPRGTLHRDFRHMSLDMYVEDGFVHLSGFFLNKKLASKLYSAIGHIRNMMIGVTAGFRYKLKFAYAHFPINTAMPKDGSSVEIRNFLGEKRSRHVAMREGVTIKEGDKDEVVLEGNDVDKVSQTAADLHMSTLVKKKDIRKFLDGTYVSWSGPIPQEE